MVFLRLLKNNNRKTILLMVLEDQGMLELLLERYHWLFDVATGLWDLVGWADRNRDVGSRGKAEEGTTFFFCFFWTKLQCFTWV